ncbi:hypothetical protein LR48_Vigan549s000800 [Vigna angularis]|uniref:BAR domain-containing protein n=3 Tax=Phaseolus angularis TaxID=3914 RepID=A0A0L9TD63_PHAAN|nr:uncharacterized protein At2g33490 isoform X1 [Vigna angularis]KAG2403704.1 uncharacterized protein HKW66_Vig0106240 [Vigna angularis]KOM28453.1 hypothetical protein LR48_Vigan549s000800 [Vigna angularis]BAT82924.1 hypothetical protein VIGAN_04000800 [Vigna angularis var. angularis]
MKSSLKKLRGLALHNHNHNRTRKDDSSNSIQPLGQLDELARATQDMQDMRDCYDTLLSAAAATASSAYEFSESLRDMGSCLLEKTALNDHADETGKLLLTLGKIQFKLHKLIDDYRSHIIQTITVPSESLLNELRIVEEMKRQCDEKRDVYDYMVARYREGGRSKGGKGETFSLQQLQTAHDEYDEEATLFVFRLKSLKQGQSRSLLTQATRHHASQLCFFKKAVKSLETVEPHVKSVTEQQHIDYQFSGLEEEDGYEGDDGDDGGGGYDDNDDGELSFDYGQTEQDRDVSTSRNSMELDQVEVTAPGGFTSETAKENLDKLQRNLFSFRVRTGSQSAPLFADNKPDAIEKLRQMRPSLSRKFSSYVLPTPVDAKSSISSSSNNPKPSKVQANLSEPTKNLWHSSPLEQKKHEKDSGDEFSGSIVRSAPSVHKESNSNTASTRLPLPLADNLLSSNRDYISAHPKKIKRYAFSGPLTSNPGPTRPVLLESVQLFSGPLLPSSIPQPRSSSPKVSPTASPTLVSSPKISELHELPRPPTNFPSNSRLLGLVGHSGPLLSGGQKVSSANNLAASSAASPLPMPPQAMARSFSIPSSGARVAALHVPRTLDSSHGSSISETIASPLIPLALSSSQPSSDC